jgi:methionyl-tRNA synthetase
MILGHNRKPGRFGPLNLPWDVPANEFLQFAGAKFSKSRGNAFYVLDLLRHFDSDAVRYYLIANMPEKGDTDWTWPDFVAKVNDELADVLGNYVNRVLTMSQANFGGAPNIDDVSDHKSQDEAFVKLRLEAASARLEHCEFKDGLREILAIARFGNQRMNETAPWAALKRGDVGKDEAGRTLMWHLGLIKTISRSIAPFLPELSEAIWLQLGEAGPTPREDSAKGFVGVASDRQWPAQRLRVARGQKFGQLTPLVKKLELKAVLEEFGTSEKAETKMPENVPAAPAAPKVKLEEFQKMELRVGVVKDVRDHPKADKLYLIKVEIGGGEVRQLVAGLRGHVKPEELLGKQVVIIANLEHAKIRGEESQGMILAAEDDTGLVAPLTPAKHVKPGAKIR